MVRRRLLAVPGVSQVTPIGGAERQFQVVAHPDALRANNVSLTELLDAARGASENTSAGVYVEGPQEYVLQAVGRVRSADEIGDSVVAMRGSRSVLIRDVADVREGAALKRGEGSRSGKPGGHRRRPEAAGRQHDRGHRAARSRARRPAGAAAAGHHHRSPHLPPGRLHPGRRQQRDRGAARRRHPRDRRRADLPGQHARRRHHADRDAAVARGRDPGAARLRRDDQHDDAGRPGDRHRRARRRRDHRRRERGAAAARERGAAGGAAPARGGRRARCDARNPARRSSSRRSSSCWCSCRSSA